MDKKKIALLLALSVLLVFLAAGTVWTAFEVVRGEYEVAGDGVSLIMLLAFLTYADSELVLFLREKFEGEEKGSTARGVVLIYLVMAALLIVVGIICFSGSRNEEVESLGEGGPYSIPPEMDEEILLPQIPILDDYISSSSQAEEEYAPEKTKADSLPMNDEVEKESISEDWVSHGDDEKIQDSDVVAERESGESDIVGEMIASQVYEIDEPDESEVLIPSSEEIGTTEETMASQVPEIDEPDESEILIPSSEDEAGVEEMKGETEEVRVPSAPMMYYIPRLYEVTLPLCPELSVTSSHMVETTEKYEDEYIPVPSIYGDESEEDFWASFYIAGEDELSYESGIYYMNLYVNDQLYGTIETFLDGDNLSLKSEELKAYVQDTITDEAFSLLFSSAADYMMLSELDSRGVASSYDLDTFNVYLTFSTADMPLQIISIAGNNRMMVSRPIANSMMLEPATFTLSSRYSIQASTSLYPFSDIWNDARLYISSYNTLRLFDVYGSFNYSFNLTPSSFAMAFGSYSFYHDFEDAMIRLSWGNVSPDLLYPDGTSLGIRFDKSLSYGPMNARRRSHIERYVTIEKESDVQIINEGKEIYRRTLAPGNYRLEDFVLYSGANKIQIIITPLDGSDVIIDEIDLIYSSSLLAPGEMYYGAGLFTGRNTVRRSSSKVVGALRIPFSSERALEYDFRNIVASGYLRAGLTTNLTMNTSVAFKNSVEANDFFNPSGRFALELTHANILGTTRYNFNLAENAYDGFTLPSLYARVSHQAYTGIKAFSGVNASLTYNGSAKDDYYDSSRLSGALNFSGAFNLLSWSLGLSGTLNLNDLEYSTWYTSATLSMNLGSNFYLSGSATFSSIGSEPPVFSGRISGTVRFGRSRATASYSGSSSSLSYTYSGRGNYFDVRVNTNDFTKAENYNLNANYSHTGDKFSFSMGLNASDMFRNNRLSFSTSFATVFADGLFAFSSYVPSNFILIQQKGALKGNRISIGAVGTSRPDDVAMFFNTGLYTGLSLGRGMSMSVYSAPDGSFSSGTSVDISIPSSRLGGYVLRLEGENRYSVSGIAYTSSGELWINSSSPVYSVTFNDDGSISLTMSEHYLFTDQDGRFIVSDLLPGVYAFDVDGPSGWEAHIFEVLDEEKERYNVLLLEDAKISNYALPSPYSVSYTYQGGEYVTYDEFWQLLYPEEVAL